MSQENKYKVSIIVPCYQVEQFIYESVLSMKKQDFDNYEIILVDDGTKDNCIQVAKKALHDFKDYKIVHKENGGLPSARNAGLKEAEGEFVCFLDSDDVVAPSHLKDLYGLCKNNNLQVSFALYESTTESTRKGSATPESSSVIIEKDKFLPACMERRYQVHCCALLINRAFLLNNNLFFDERLKFAEDTEYRWRLFPMLDRIGCTNKKTYKYMMRSNSLMRSQSTERVLLAMQIMCETIRKSADNNPDYKHIWNVLPQRVCLSFCRGFARSSTFQSFLHLANNISCKPNMGFVIKYKNLKVKLLALSFILSKRLFYKLSHF